MKPLVVVWRRRVYDPQKKRWQELRWRMSEDQAAKWAAKEGVQIERIEGSREERQDIYGDGPGPGAACVTTAGVEAARVELSFCPVTVQ